MPNKRKRSVYDIEMQSARQRFPASQEVSGTEGQPTKCFSSVDKNDLMSMGINRKVLVVNEECLHDGTAFTDSAYLLCAQINRIYRFVSMPFEPAARMILDAILLAVAELSADGDPKSPVAIYPEMRIGTGDGVSIVNPKNGFRMRLTGNVDFGLCTYADESQRTRVLEAALDDVMRFACNRIILVERKREAHRLYDSMPEAISQAAAFSEATGINAICFCLSDGRGWIFSLFEKDNRGNRTCYEGDIFRITEPRLGLEAALQQDVHRILKLLHHWLVAKEDPLTDPWYELKDL